MKADDSLYWLKENIEFGSPSAAAEFVLGGSCNGWSEWVNSSGQTLSGAYRTGETK